MAREKLASAELPWWLHNMGAGCAFKEQAWNRSTGSSSLAAWGAPWLSVCLPRFCLVLDICKIIVFSWWGGEEAVLLNERMERCVVMIGIARGVLDNGHFLNSCLYCDTNR